MSPEELLKVYEYIMSDEGDKYAMMFTDLHRKASLQRVLNV